MNALIFIKNLGYAKGKDNSIVTDKETLYKELKEIFNKEKHINYESLIESWKQQQCSSTSIESPDLNFDKFADLFEYNQELIELAFWDGFFNGLKERDICIKSIAKQVINELTHNDNPHSNENANKWNETEIINDIFNAYNDNKIIRKKIKIKNKIYDMELFLKVQKPPYGNVAIRISNEKEFKKALNKKIFIYGGYRKDLDIHDFYISNTIKSIINFANLFNKAINMMSAMIGIRINNEPYTLIINLSSIPHKPPLTP